MEIAKEKAKQIFKIDFKHQGAIVLFGDCLLRSLQVESGIKGFTKIFEKDFATNTSTFVLTVLVWFYRANGNLNDFLKILAKSAKHQLFEEKENGKPKSYPNGGNDPNLNYCYGVYYFTIRNYNLAIEELTKSRFSPELVGPANLILIDIYLHSNSFNLYSNFLQKEKFKNVPKNHLEIIKILVSELNEDEYRFERKIYEVVLDGIIDPNKVSECTKSLETFRARQCYDNFQSFVLYFLCLFYLKTKEKDKLKATLQSIKNLTFKPRQCLDHYYFRANMLCVDTMLYKDKLKPAKAIIDQCIGVSKSCLLPYDYFLIYNEKVKESCVEVLKTAFEITNQEDPNIGYKLAKDLMGEGKSNESFKVCKTVLTKYPKFKQIEKDVLLKVKEDLLNNY